MYSLTLALGKNSSVVDSVRPDVESVVSTFEEYAVPVDTGSNEVYSLTLVLGKDSTVVDSARVDSAKVDSAREDVDSVV